MGDLGYRVNGGSDCSTACEFSRGNHARSCSRGRRRRGRRYETLGDGWGTRFPRYGTVAAIHLL